MVVTIVCVLLLALLRLYPNRELRRIIRGDVDRLLCRDSAGWRQAEVPGIPYEIQTGFGGEVWVATYMPGGLSRWAGGQWTHYGSSHSPSGGFAVSGQRVWVASETGIERFDGQKWQRLPVKVREPMATAAEGNEVWVINGLGSLTHCVADDCETRSVTNQIHDDAWKSHILGHHSRYQDGRPRRIGDKTLVRTPGRLWFIHNVAWYSSDGRQWTEWQGSGNERVWPLGYSGGRIWVKTWESLLAIGEDLQATQFPLDSLDSPSVYRVHAGDGRVMMASGFHGLSERTGGSWRPVPVDLALHAEDVRNVASTPEGVLWITASRQPAITRLYVLAGVIGMVLLVWNVAAHYREKRVRC